MARTVPAMILASMAGASFSMSSGFLLATYVISGMGPAHVAPPRLARAIHDAPAFIDDNWPTPDYTAPTN